MMVRIDFSKAGKYKSHTWIAMEEKQKKNEGKITYWRAQRGTPFTVRRGRLYDGKYMIYRQKGWGLTGGSYRYYLKKGKHYISNPFFDNIYNSLKKRMVRFNIPLLSRDFKKL